MKSNIWHKVYCVNSECSKKEACIRYVESPRTDGDNKKFEEHWNGVACNKYRQKHGVMDGAPTTDMTAAEEFPIAFVSSIPQEMELREHLIRHIGENLDKVFHGDATWAKTTHHYSLIASRIVDLLMPTIVAKKNMRTREYR